jgi:O-antigen/teichoic acid export membrane protein
LCYSGLRLIGQHRWITLLQSALAVASLLLALLLPLVSQPILVFAIGRAILSVVAAVAAVALTRRFLPAAAPSSTSISLTRLARPFLLADIAVLFYSRVSLTLVSLFVGATATAAFGSADNFINLAFWAPTALYLLVLPILSRAQGLGQQSGFVRIGMLQLAAQALVGLAESVAIFLLAPTLIRVVYGDAYSASIPILQWFCAIPFFKALNFGTGAWLTASGNQAARTRVQIAIALFTVVLGLVAISGWGVVGGAVVEVATEIFLCFGYAAVLLNLRRRERLTPDPLMG